MELLVVNIKMENVKLFMSVNQMKIVFLLNAVIQRVVFQKIELLIVLV